jgi:mevalonate kinase
LKLHKKSYLEGNYVSFDSIYIKEKESLPKGLTKYMNNENYNKEFIDKLKVKVNNDFNEINKIDNVALLEYINNNQSLVNSLHFINSLKIHELFNPYKQIRLESLQKINNFIETGILINE